MLTLIIRAIICYLLVLLVFRLMGKRQIGQMQPFELVLTLVIADLATIPMAESSIPTLHGIVPLITLVVVHYFLTLFSKKSRKIGEIISGKPIIVINPDGVDFNSLEKLDITIEDLFEAIRGVGYFKLEEVQYAIMETNGIINVLPKTAFAPVTNEYMKIKGEEATLPLTLVSEGSISKENLKIGNISEERLSQVLKEQKVENIKNVLVFTIDKFGSCYLQENNKPFKTFSIDYKGDNLS